MFPLTRPTSFHQFELWISQIESMTCGLPARIKKYFSPTEDWSGVFCLPQLVFKWHILITSTKQLFVAGHLVSVKLVGKATACVVHSLGESHEFLRKPVSISTTISLISQSGEMWQKTDNSAVIPLMASKDTIMDTYIIAWISFFSVSVVLSMSSSGATEHVRHLQVWPGFIPSSVLAAGYCTGSVETCFHRDAAGFSRRRDGCMLSVEAHWKSSYMDTGQSKK